MSTNFWFDNSWLAGAPMVLWEPPTKANDSETVSGKEWDGVVPISGDAIELCHSMRWKWWVRSPIRSGLVTHSPILWGWFSTMFASGVQRFSGINCFYGPCVRFCGVKCASWLSWKTWNCALIPSPGRMLSTF
jgi:hypothetical protein